MRRGGTSAGLLLYRRSAQGVEFFLAHPGGPFWKNRDDGAWTIPKGAIEAGEEPLEAARREFREETGIEPAGPYVPLGTIKQKAGKVIHGWAWEGDVDPSCIVSANTRVRQPRTGQWIIVPEIDRCAWFTAAEARQKLNPAQAAFVDRVLETISEKGPRTQQLASGNSDLGAGP